MQTERSGARKQHKDEKVLSPQEFRGQVLKRHVRAAAALNDLYDDVSLGVAVGRNRAAVGNWWKGSKPEPEVLIKLARVTGLSMAELTETANLSRLGGQPSLPIPDVHGLWITGSGREGGGGSPT